MNAAINVAREKGPVEIKQAAYSLAEMEADAEKIGEAMKARGGSDIQSIVTKYDGSGLDVERMPADAAAKETLERANAGLGALKSADQVLAGVNLSVPVRITTASERIELMASRRCDSPPWNGGGNFEIERPGVGNLGSCTT